MSQLLAMYNSVGNAAFSGMIGQIAPFFSTINATFTELRPNFAEITMPFRREVTNHLGTVHAIAMCNMAELVAGTMTDASIPAGCRWIPKAMSVHTWPRPRPTCGRCPAVKDWTGRRAATSRCRWTSSTPTGSKSFPRKSP